MALIVVAEDDPGTLRLLGAVLQRQGHDVIGRADGSDAWACIQSMRPDLVVSDVNMPGLSGFDLLARIRATGDLALTPVILLTSLQERQNMRLGMRMGADDYLTKPFQREELIEAVNAQLGKQALRAAAQDMQVHARLNDALEAQAEDYESRLAAALDQQWPGVAADHAQADIPEIEGYVLCAGILEYERWSASLTPPESARLLKRFHESCGDTIHLFSASHMQFGNDAVVALYTARGGAPGSEGAAPGLRAIKAALGLRRSVAALRSFIGRQLPDRNLPAFDIGIALHRGPVGLLRLEGLLGGAVQTVPVGQTVTDALAILRHAAGADAPITVTVPVLRSVTGTVRPTHRYLLTLPHRPQPMDVCRIEAPTT